MIKKGGNSQRAQIQLSYGMIFSVFLIVIFMVVAFIAIRTFLDIEQHVNTKIFVRNLQTEINDVHRSSANQYPSRESLGTKITHVCFFDRTIEVECVGEFRQMCEEFKGSGGDNEANLYFYPKKYADESSIKINKVDMQDFDSNPYCFENRGGFVEMELSKNRGEDLVRIS